MLNFKMYVVFVLMFSRKLNTCSHTFDTQIILKIRNQIFLRVKYRGFYPQAEGTAWNPLLPRTIFYFCKQCHEIRIVRICVELGSENLIFPIRQRTSSFNFCKIFCSTSMSSFYTNYIPSYSLCQKYSPLFLRYPICNKEHPWLVFLQLCLFYQCNANYFTRTRTVSPEQRFSNLKVQSFTLLLWMTNLNKTNKAILSFF